MKKRIAILGSTGTLGVQALNIIDRDPEHFEVTALTANVNVDLAIEQAHRYKPQLLCFTGRKYDADIVSRLPKGTEAAFGRESLLFACRESGADLAFIAVVGIAGLPALTACIDSGVKVALANKEALVCGGNIVRRRLDDAGMEILPVDSELSAVFQCLGGNYDLSQVHRIILTASGGPFRTWAKEDILSATPEQALKHPNWRMGKKITVDCATYMNKGLEVIETRWLFNIPPEKIDVVVHPQSTVHSMVEYKNGSILAQLSPTDMRQSIQYAFSWPERLDSAIGFLDFTKLRSLTFELPDVDRFPLLPLAYEALKAGDGACVVLNAANEVAVEFFLEGRIRLGGIIEIIDDAMQHFGSPGCTEIGEVYALDRHVRKYVQEKMAAGVI